MRLRALRDVANYLRAIGVFPFIHSGQTPPSAVHPARGWLHQGATPQARATAQRSGTFTCRHRIAAAEEIPSGFGSRQCRGEQRTGGFTRGKRHALKRAVTGEIGSCGTAAALSPGSGTS